MPISDAQKRAMAKYRASAKGKATRTNYYALEETKAKGRELSTAWRASNPLKFMLARAKSRAKEKGFAFDLTAENFPTLPDTCPVLGLPLKYIDAGAKMGDPCIATFDRIDNSKGYVRGNVAIVSLRANRLKHNATLEELEALVSWLKLNKE